MGHEFHVSILFPQNMVTDKQVSGSEHNDAPGLWPVGGEHGWVLAFAIANSVLLTAAKNTKMPVQINDVKESAVKAT